jgi:hypothetical protein
MYQEVPVPSSSIKKDFVRSESTRGNVPLPDVVSLKGDLQAAESHPKPHGVHIHVVGQGCRRRTPVIVAQLAQVLHKRRRRLLILEYRHVDGHLFAATLAYVRREPGETRMAQENCLRRPKQRLRKVGRTARIRRRWRPREVRTAQPRIGGERHADLVGREMGLHLAAPRPHVVLHGVEEGHAAAVGAARRALHHVGAVLGPPDGSQLEGAGLPGALLLLLLERLRAGEDGEQLLGAQADARAPRLVV